MMCDRITEPPTPGTDLFTYWREEPFPAEGEERDFPLGNWTLRVRITRVKDSLIKDGRKHVTMMVIG